MYISFIHLLSLVLYLGLHLLYFRFLDNEMIKIHLPFCTPSLLGMGFIVSFVPEMTVCMNGAGLECPIS